MSRIPRTPVHFPRMKVRGKRNRAKLAARYTTRTIMHVVFDSHDPVTGAVTAHVVPQGKATHVLAYDGGTRDGYGRKVPTPAPRPVIAPRRMGKSLSASWSMGFTFSQSEDQRDAFKDMFDTLTGEKL